MHHQRHMIMSRHTPFLHPSPFCLSERHSQHLRSQIDDSVSLISRGTGALGIAQGAPLLALGLTRGSSVHSALPTIGPFLVAPGLVGFAPIPFCLSRLLHAGHVGSVSCLTGGMPWPRHKLPADQARYYGAGAGAEIMQLSTCCARHTRSEQTRISYDLLTDKGCHCQGSSQQPRHKRIGERFVHKILQYDCPSI